MCDENIKITFCTFKEYSILFVNTVTMFFISLSFSYSSFSSHPAPRNWQLSGCCVESLSTTDDKVGRALQQQRGKKASKQKRVIELIIIM